MAGTIIGNPLLKEKSSSDSASAMEYCLLGEQKHGDLVDEPNKHFIRLLVKRWPFRFLKTINWLLLLIITILCAVGAGNYNFVLAFSSCWRSALRPLWRLTGGYSLVAVLVIASLMATGSLAIQRWKGKTQLASIALADFSLGWAFILVQLLIASVYGSRSYCEINYYYPKLRNSSISLAELTDWGRGHFEPPPQNLEEMEERKLFIMVRLVLDPMIMILALVAVLLQAGLLLSISRTIKRSRVWASNYRLEHPNCTEQEAKYANFWPLGLIKLAQVAISMSFLFALPLNDGPHVFFSNMVIYALLAIACLANRLHYVQKVRFRREVSTTKTQAEENEQFANFCRKDCFFYFFGLLAVGFLRIFVTSQYYRYREIYKLVDLTILGLFFIAFLFTFSLQSGSGQLELKLGSIGKALRIPRISIKVQFTDNENSDEEEQKLKKDVEEVAAGQMEKA